MVEVAGRKPVNQTKYSSDLKIPPFVFGSEKKAPPKQITSFPYVEPSTSVASDYVIEKNDPPTTSISLRAEHVIRRAQDKGVQVPDASLIRRYLSTFDDTADLTEILLLCAVERFSSNSQLSLELYQSKEIDDEYLTICIRQTSYEEGLMEKIEELSALFDDHLCQISGWVQITTDFRPPE
ncbi:MAG: hypothetical protein ACYTEQ_21135 [Planctomycetota bacterium]|jgi:hypothetical protein